MIEGIHCDVPGMELIDMVSKQGKAHADKAAFYATKAEEFAKMNIGEGNSSMDAVRDVKGKRAEHIAQATYFDFLASHLVAHETYRLDENDLRKLGFKVAY